MRTRQNLLWKELKLGISITVALFLLAVGIMAVGGQGGGFWTPKISYYTTLPTASGLYVGSLVMIDGVEVGTVRAIDFDPEGQGVRIRFQVARPFIHRIREDSRVMVMNLGLLGDRYLNITSGSMNRKQLPPGSTIPGKAGEEMTDIMKELKGSVDDMKQTVANLNTITSSIKEGKGVVGALLMDESLKSRFEQIVSRLENGEGTLGKFMKDESIYNRLDSILAKLESKESALGLLLNDKETSHSLKKMISTLEKLMARIHEGEGTLGQLMMDDTLYTKLTALVENLEDITRKAENQESSLGKFLNDDALYERINKLLSEIEAMVRDMKKHPKKYFSVKIALIAF